MIRGIIDEEWRKTGEERRTYVEWVDMQGRQGRGYHWQKSHTHRLTKECLCHLQSSLPCQSFLPKKKKLTNPFPYSLVSLFLFLSCAHMPVCLLSLVKITEKHLCVPVLYIHNSVHPFLHACLSVCCSLVCRDLSRLPRANELHLNPAPLILPLAQFLRPWGSSLFWPGNCGMAAAILAH